MGHRSNVIVNVDYALVGGGLQNALIALAVRAAQPSARIAMIERGAAPGGNHTWCFHAGDLDVEARAWIEPLVATRWDGYEVAFPAFTRTLASAYACVTSDRVAQLVTDALALPGSSLMTNTLAVGVAPHQVTARGADGTTQTIRATAVIDARGPDRASDRNCGWQKFVGRELDLTAPHELDHPMLMDATVPQLDGFRFFYVLPLSPTRVLVEDTYFSDTAYLDVAAVRLEIDAYVARRGWQVSACAREEVGVLPLPLRVTAPVVEAPLIAGYAGGWFHPVTGYSFPIAARLAAVIATRPASELYGPELGALAAEHTRQLHFAARLNHMLFRWFAPDQRYHVLARFYDRLPEPTIRRFYALALTPLDRARILVGKPPRGLSLRGVLGLEAP